MYYHIFPNLGELLQGYLVSKIRLNLASKAFLDRECNCNTNTKVKGRCTYGGEYRRCCVIYKVTCKCCVDFYVGNTPNNFKKRLKQHFQDVAQKVANNKNSDYFAPHFAKHFTQKTCSQECREIMSFDIVYTVNPKGSMKTWSKLSCTLCMKERIEIINNSRRRYSRIINTCS